MALARYRAGVDGPFGAAEVRHLFRRGGFGLPIDECEALARDGLDAALARLFAADEGRVATLALKDGDVVAAGDDLPRLQALWLLRIATSEAPALEKLALFWHGHFATSNEKVKSAALMWGQYRLFRERGAGPFRELLEEIARDPAMLVWLDSNSNGRIRPNENFARELMELFSLGVGNYGERDVQEAARAFTGWHVRADRFWFDPREHDGGEKQVLARRGALDGGAVIDACVEYAACPRFLAGKLLRFYVNDAPDATAIEELAQVLGEHDLAVGPALQRLLSSQLFFSAAARGALIQSPVEFCVASLRALRGTAAWRGLAEATAEMGQALFAPPSVKGWDGQRAWINSRTLLARGRFAEALAFGGGSLAARVDWRRVSAATAAGDAGTQVDALASLLLGVAPSATTRAALCDFAGSAAAGDGEARTRALAHLLLSSPEAQLH